MGTYSRAVIISVSGPEDGLGSSVNSFKMHAACMTRWRDIVAQGLGTPAGVRNQFNYLENKQEQWSSNCGMTSVLICSPLLPLPVIICSSLSYCDFLLYYFSACGSYFYYWIDCSAHCMCFISHHHWIQESVLEWLLKQLWQARRKSLPAAVTAPLPRWLSHPGASTHAKCTLIFC